MDEFHIILKKKLKMNAGKSKVVIFEWKEVEVND